ncbi:hypothetical protein G7Y89_g7556 [Cudoniella acicularis]|uniref:Exosome complex protein n=1 Tax=Cudoniella acicularis TaxID=354080 RepID=A0A8H4RJW2_9HELO|nr:hypothetical protein G7Y89_g7556 [Cudoniella acicularis]
MDSTKVLSLLEQLDDEIDDLEDSLAPLLKTALAESASKLPLLDKAKLYVLVTYAIESVLFSYLRLNGVKAREHPVFTELTRVKQYFDKIKATENPPVTARAMTLDKVVAARFLKPDLAAAEKDALQAAEKKAKERARAHIKFEELSKNIEERENVKKRKTAETGPLPADDDEPSSDSDSSSDLDVQDAMDIPEAPPSIAKSPRKRRKVEAKFDPVATSSPVTRSKKNQGKKKAAKNPKKTKRKSA